MLSAAVNGAVADKAAYIRQAGFSPIQNEQMVLSYVRQHGRIKRAEAMELCRLSEWQTKQLHKRMCDAGAIALHGSAKASVYLIGTAQAGVSG
jgi:ATP-dependent DNA helicase RecG